MIGWLLNTANVLLQFRPDLHIKSVFKSLDVFDLVVHHSVDIGIVFVTIVMNVKISVYFSLKNFYLVFNFFDACILFGENFSVMFRDLVLVFLDDLVVERFTLNVDFWELLFKLDFKVLYLATETSLDVFLCLCKCFF